MKKLLPFLLLLFTFVNLDAQHYNAVVPEKVQYFGTTDQFVYWADPINSPVKVMYMNSFSVSGQDTSFFTFHTWRDTGFSGASYDCVLELGPAWTGNHVLKLNNGMTIFFNEDGDSIFLKTDALINESWNFMKLNDNGYVVATLDSISWMQQAGLQDSVKCFSFVAYDSLGVQIVNHSFNELYIRLSKSNGFFTTLSFYDLPFNNLINYNRIDSVPMTTYGEIYDFDIGDEFEYYYQCVNVFQNSLMPTYSYIKILSKYFSSGLDSVYYHRFKKFRSYVYNNSPTPPYFDPVVTTDEDTVGYSIDNSPLYYVFPEENLYNIDSTALLNYIALAPQ